MPATVFFPRLLQIVPHYTPNTDINQNVANVLWFQSGGSTPPNINELTNIQNAFEAVWVQIFRAVGSDNKQFVGSVITDFSSNTGLANDSRPSIYTNSGTAGGDNPAQVAALVSHKDGLRYRGGHSRVYIPWVGDNALDATDKSHLSTGTINGLTTAYQQMINAMAGSGFLGGQTLVVYHHRTSATLANVRPVQAFTVQRTLATQRRRLRKIPRHHKVIIA